MAIILKSKSYDYKMIVAEDFKVQKKKIQKNIKLFQYQ